jgi:ADP-ribose pyrophosphatase YjhB (NUDIX family)
VGAYAVCHEADRLLCVRLAPGQPSAGAWTLPGGGVDFGEDPEATVLRELEEETGLAGRVEGILAVRSGVYPGRLADGRPRELHAIAILYRVTPTGGTLRDEAAGSSDRAAWLTRAELSGGRLVRMLEAAVGVAFGAEGGPGE